MMAEWIDDSVDAPAMGVGNGNDLFCAGGDGLTERGCGVVDD